MVEEVAELIFQSEEHNLDYWKILYRPEINVPHIQSRSFDKSYKRDAIVAAVCLFVFNFFFSCGFLQIPWLYPAEVNPLAVRAQGAALATMSNWLFTWLVVAVTPVVVETLGWKEAVEQSEAVQPNCGRERRS
ncbi:hypothetical protein JCM6882_007837 [Rhodosporidiobolus microsporus]